MNGHTLLFYLSGTHADHSSVKITTFAYTFFHWTPCIRVNPCVNRLTFGTKKSRNPRVLSVTKSTTIASNPFATMHWCGRKQTDGETTDI